MEGFTKVSIIETQTPESSPTLKRKLEEDTTVVDLEKTHKKGQRTAEKKTTAKAKVDKAKSASHDNVPNLQLNDFDQEANLTDLPDLEKKPIWEKGTSKQEEESNVDIHDGFMEKLGMPLRNILRKIKVAMNKDLPQRKWPTQAQFNAANCILSRMESAKSYMSEFFLPAWEMSKGSNEITLEQISELYKKDKDQIVSNFVFKGTIVQRWNEKITLYNSSLPICFLLKESDSNENVVIIKAWNKEYGKGAVNYKLLAGLPPGAKVSISDFKVVGAEKSFLKQAFFNIQQDFEILLTDSNIEQVGASITVVPLSQLEYFRQFAKLEVVLFLTTTKNLVQCSKGPFTALIKETKANGWSLDVFDKYGSTGTLTFWDRQEEVANIVKHTGEGEITLKVTFPSSIKKFKGELIISVRDGTIIEILE